MILFILVMIVVTLLAGYIAIKVAIDIYKLLESKKYIKAVLMIIAGSFLLTMIGIIIHDMLRILAEN